MTTPDDRLEALRSLALAAGIEPVNDPAELTRLSIRAHLAKFSPAEFDEMAAAVAEARARLDHELMAAGGSLDG